MSVTTVGHPPLNRHKSGRHIRSDSDASQNRLNTALITHWLKALEKFDQGKLKDALNQFLEIEARNSKINYNIASLYATLGNYDEAIVYFKRSIESDNYMAISYFQIGVCRFLSGTYKKAAASFNTALKLLRGNSVINYQQLGLEYKLYSCEIMYNRALSYIYSGQTTVGIYDLGFAVKEKRYISEHSILDEALNHFSSSQDFIQTGVDMRSTLKLPKDFDKKAQRFSLLAPPKSSFIISSVSSNDSIASMLDPANKTIKQKSMVYSLFSVPQGSLFRLTETKVQYILGEKYSVETSNEHSSISQSQFSSNTAVIPPRSSSMGSNILSVSSPESILVEGSQQVLTSSQVTNVGNGLKIFTPSSSPNTTPTNVSSLSSLNSTDNKLLGFGKISKADVSIDVSEIKPSDKILSPYDLPKYHDNFSQSVNSKERDNSDESKYLDLKNDDAQLRFFDKSNRESIRNKYMDLTENYEPIRSLSTSLPESNNTNGQGLKVKVHYSNEIRILAVSQNITFSALYAKISQKLKGTADENFSMRVKDEDGDLILLGDQEDLNLILEETSSPKNKKLEIFVE